MNAGGGVRWGIIGTANIARGQFLPGLRSAGGVAAAVAGRDADRTEQWASDNGVERAVTGYQALIDDQVAVFQALGGGWEDAPAVVAPKVR